MRPSQHARQRMAERGITPADIASVLAGPEVTFTDTKGNPCFVREVAGRRIKVVVAADDAEFVITVVDLDS
jgi:uncharacterized protein DUF4258